MKIKTAILASYLLLPVALASDSPPVPPRPRRPTVQPWHLRCMQYMPFKDAVDYIWNSRALHQPFTREECETLLRLLIDTQEIPAVRHGRDIKNARIDKTALMEYMEKDGFGALVLLQLRQPNIYAALTHEAPDAT